MRKKIFSLLVLLMVTVTMSAMQIFVKTLTNKTITVDVEPENTTSDEPEPIELKPGESNRIWILSEIPGYDVELEVEYDTELALNEEADNTATLEEWDGYEADVTLTRTLKTGGWNTLAVPFNVSSDALEALNGMLAAQGGSFTVKKLVSTAIEESKLYLNFEDATEIEAGKPYLVKVSKDIDFATLPATIDAAIALGQMSVNPFHDAEVSKDPVTVETTYIDFIPTLGKTLVTGPAGNEDDTKVVLFVAANNQLVNPTVVNDPEQESSFIKGFRAYFQLKGEAADARTFCMDYGDGEQTTGIIGVMNTISTNDTKSIYDLQGRKVEKASQKGVYIVNGNKFVVK